MKNDRVIKILAILTAVIIFAYIGISAYNSVGSGYKTSTAYIQEVAGTVDAEMYIIRSETILDSKEKGIVVPLAVNGERVSSGSKIAAVFADEKSAENYVNAMSLKKKLEIYKKIDNQVRLANTDIEKLSGEIYNDFYSMLDAVYDNDFSTLDDDELAFGEKLSRKNISLNYEVDCKEQIAQLESKINELSSSNPSSIVTADMSGYYVSRPDGYEDVLKPDDIDSLTEEKLSEALKAEKEEVPDGSLGKIIDSYDWYVAAVADSGDLSGVAVGGKINLMLGDGKSETVASRVYSKKIIEGNRTLLVFKCSNMSEKLATLRKVTGKIVIKTYSGIKIPKDAVRFNENNEMGVYIREGNLIKFNKVEEIYSNDSFVVVKDKTGSPGWLAQYDEIIISGKELSNGKVIE